MPRLNLFLSSGIFFLSTNFAVAQFLPRHPTIKQVVGYHTMDLQRWQSRTLPTNSVLFKMDSRNISWRMADGDLVPNSKVYFSVSQDPNTRTYFSVLQEPRYDLPAPGDYRVGTYDFNLLNPNMPNRIPRYSSRPVRQQAWRTPSTSSMGAEILRDIITSQ